MTALGPSSVYDLAERVRVCVHDQLATTGAGAPERSCVVWGAEVAADGCDCGQLAVTVTRIYPSAAFPAEAAAAEGAGSVARCGAPYLVADLTVSVLRCVAVPDDGSLSVSCATLAGEAAALHADAHAARVGAHCCLLGALDDDEISDFLLVDQVPVGPSGGCAGSELHVKVEFVNACPCQGVG